MEKKNNIAEILKDKPKGIRLYSPIFGECAFCYVREDANDICVKKHNGVIEYFNSEGLYCALGEVMLFPSKSMRDWEKFAWKRGDVLVNKDGDVYIIFERFSDDTYCSFVGKYYLWKENNDTEHFYKNERLLTSDFQKASKDAAQTYISAIEERLGGKLNLQTLEIEKQLEFKDGDIVVYGKSVAICRKIYKHTLSFYVSLNEMFGLLFADEVESSEEYRFATEEEKQQLFDALEKEGKAWDAEKKLIVDLKPKCEFKPFDKVLCRNSKDDTWEADFFARLTRKEIDYTQSGKYLCVGDLWMYCIPYIGNESLLGTTKDVEG